MTRSFHYDMPKARDCDSEIAVQKACRTRIAKQFPRTAVAAVPNGQKRTRWQQGQAKAEGIAKGFPDMVAIGPGAIAFLEIKAAGSLTPEQSDWLDHLTRCGFNAGVFRSQESLAAKLKEWGFS
jgi:hypothetical protein